MRFSDRAFIFDMDGTLIDNMRYHTEAWRTLMGENGLEFDERLIERRPRRRRRAPRVVGAAAARLQSGNEHFG